MSDEPDILIIAAELLHARIKQTWGNKCGSILFA